MNNREAGFKDQRTFKVQHSSTSLSFMIEKLVSGQVHYSNIRLGYNTKQPSFILHYPRVFTGNKKASPFWLEEGLAKHPLSICTVDIRCLDSKDGRSMVVSL
jgi:hypothetical protein